jgi:hypothetical protein
MKKFKHEIVILVMGFVVACASVPSDPHKPEMSVDKTPSQSKTYNQFRRDWEY